MIQQWENQKDGTLLETQTQVIRTINFTTLQKPLPATNGSSESIKETKEEIVKLSSYLNKENTEDSWKTLISPKNSKKYINMLKKSNQPIDFFKIKSY